MNNVVLSHYQLNELFITDDLNDADMVNYAHTVCENELVMNQIANNTRVLAMLGRFSKAIDDAIMDNGDAHKNQMMQLLSDPSKAAKFADIVFDLLQGNGMLRGFSAGPQSFIREREPLRAG